MLSRLGATVRSSCRLLIVNEDGQTLYCRKELKTGSRVRSNLVCLTEGRLLAEQQSARNFLEGIRRKPNRMRE